MFNFAGVACMEVLSNSDPMLYSVALFFFIIYYFSTYLFCFRYICRHQKDNSSIDF